MPQLPEASMETYRLERDGKHANQREFGLFFLMTAVAEINSTSAGNRDLEKYLIDPILRFKIGLVSFCTK
jgi:hypothetical protein